MRKILIKKFNILVGKYLTII